MTSEKLDCTLPFLGDEVEGGPFKGKVRFYHLKKGFGFIEPDDDIPGVEWGDDEKDKKRFHVNRCDIVSDDEPPALKQGESVEFKVFKNDKGYSAREVTGPDGAKIHHERTDFGNSGGGGGGGQGWGKRGRPDGGWGNRGGWGPKRPRNGGPGPMDSNGQIEVGLAVKKYHVGGIIGTKGSNIRSITKESGANLQFGQQDVYCMGEPHCVLAISG